MTTDSTAAKDDFDSDVEIVYAAINRQWAEWAGSGAAPNESRLAQIAVEALRTAGRLTDE